jgi:hypothetical protein
LILLHIKLVSFYEHVNTQIIDTGAEKTTVKLIEFELHPTAVIGRMASPQQVMGASYSRPMGT